VVTIIAVISAMGVVSYTTANRNARDGRRMADLSQVRAALELYRTDKGYYPKTSGNWAGLMTALTGYITPATVTDPKPSVYSYSYTTAGNLGKTYELCAYKEKGGTDSCAGACGSGIVCNYKVVNP